MVLFLAVLCIFHGFLLAALPQIPNSYRFCHSLPWQTCPLMSRCHLDQNVTGWISLWHPLSKRCRAEKFLAAKRMSVTSAAGRFLLANAFYKILGGQVYNKQSGCSCDIGSGTNPSGSLKHFNWKLMRQLFCRLTADKMRGGQVSDGKVIDKICY